MAKKKNASEQENKLSVDSPLDDSSRNAVDAAPEVCEETPSLDSEANRREAMPPEPCDAAKAFDAHNAADGIDEYRDHHTQTDVHSQDNRQQTASKDDAGRTTGKLILDGESYTDDQMLSRLRASVLTTSELYREAQIFESQKLDVSAMVLSAEPCLVQNTLEIARILSKWIPECISIFATFTPDAPRTRDIVEQYVLHSLKAGIAPIADTIDAIVQVYRRMGDVEWMASFIEKIRIVLVNMTAQNQGDPAELQHALSCLCTCFDAQTLDRMLCDPAPEVRIAVLRSLAGKSEIPLNTLSVVLILLKDRNEAVNEAVMKLCAKLKPYPDLVIPQVLPLLPSAGRDLRGAIEDLLRSYGDRAIDPVMESLNDTRESLFDAVVQVVAFAPQRYTEALLNALQNPRTRDFVRVRIAQILRHHKDASRLDAISSALKRFDATTAEIYPRWEPPKSHDDLFIARATDDKDFYTRYLSDDELLAFSQTCDESSVLRLMSDAAEIAQINALKLVRLRGSASAVTLENIAIWLRCENPNLAKTAADTWFEVHPDKTAAVREIIDSITRIESKEIQTYDLEKIRLSPDAIDALFKLFYEQPKKLHPFVQYMLTHEPSQKTRDNLLKGMERQQPVACIAETLDLLLKLRIEFDNRPIRTKLLALLQDPVSFGHYGLMARLRSVALLHKYLKDDETRDKSTIAALQAFYKVCKNADIRHRIKEMMKDLDEEIFDFEDEDDDFEDLNDEDESFH